MRNALRRVLQVSVFFLFPAAGHAGTLSIRVEPPDAIKAIRKVPTWNIVLEGEIDPEAPARVEAALKRAGPGGADVYINSPGGNLFAGMEIGRLLRRARVNTHVGTLVPDLSRAAVARLAGRPAVKVLAGHCYSACSLAFLGGVRRTVPQGSEYGVHRFSVGSSPGESDLKTTRSAASAVMAYMRDMGVNPALFDLMAKKGRSGIRILGEAELVGLGVVNAGGKRSPE